MPDYICPKCGQPGIKAKMQGRCINCRNAADRERYRKQKEAQPMGYCKTETDRVMTQFLSMPWVDNHA